MVHTNYWISLMSFEYHSILMYHIHGLFGGNFNLAVWQIS